MTSDDPLLAARARVLHDLTARGLADAETVSVLERAVAQRRWWLSHWNDGAPFVAGLVAQDVQDGLLDRVARWPLCQNCDGGTRHALYIEPELGPDPHWICEQSGAVVAALGQLA